jgi:hypothetical protein
MNTYQIFQQKMVKLAFTGGLLLMTISVVACSTQSTAAQPASTAEQNKQLIQEALEMGFNRGDMGAFDKYFAADFIEHEELPPGTPPGLEGVKAAMAMMRTAFPDSVCCITP